MLPLQYALRLSAAKHNSIPHAAAAARNLDAAIPLRSAQTELHSTIATHYCRTHRFDAPVPMHKMFQHAKHNSTASTKKKKSHLEPSVPLRAQIEQESTAKQRIAAPVGQASQLFSATEPPLTKKTQCFDMFRANPNIQIASMM